MRRLTDLQVTVLSLIERLGGEASIPELSTEIDRMPSQILRICRAIERSGRLTSKVVPVFLPPLGKIVEGEDYVYAGSVRFRATSRSS
jgi:hypothetical protein